MTFRVTSPEEVDDLHALEVPWAADRRRRSWADRAVFLLPAALMLGVGVVGLDRHSVWRDEAASLVAARRTLPQLWAMLGHVDTVHAFYYTLLHGWLRLGGGEVWARVPSVLAMAAAAGLVGLIGARLVSNPVGVVAGLLLVANPAASYYAQEARSTALVAAFALLATWLLLNAVRGRAAWWAAYAAACVVLVGLNLLAFLVPIALALTLVWWGSPRRVLLRWALATAPALVLAGALVVISGQQPFQIGWIPAPDLSSVREFAHLALGPTLPLVLLVALLVLVGILPTRSPSQRRLRALGVPLLVLPTAVLLAVSFVQPIFVPRYVFPSVVAVSLLAAVGVVRLARLAGSRVHRMAATVVVAGAVLVVAVGGLGAQRLDRTPASRPDDLAGAAAVVADQARPGDAVLFLPDNRRLVELVYPGSFANVRDVALAADPVEVGNLTGRTLPLPTVVQNLSASQRVWVIGRPGLALTPAETDAQTELDLLDRTFVPVEHTAVHGVEIALYVQLSAPA
ncbi:MAG TPA: glycosyltransferase family 39 protein [Friedmanniella sp.]